MRTFVIFGFLALMAAGCRTSPDAAAGGGYVGVDRIEILAKGME